ncbi:SIR2 family protein [Rhodococcus qingshengii]|uniref:SIR2 family protein n=1 Tax=Rhodococcus qingshengii TaxID=334542 RepID=UPI00311C9DE6
MDVYSKMQAALACRTAVFVVGTGVTAASVDDTRNCSWPGLLKSGLAFLETSGLLDHPMKKSVIEQEIEIGSSEDGSYLISAAQKIVDIMGGATSSQYSLFLEQEIGSLTLSTEKSGLARVLTASEVPIITTNYDTVLEQAGYRSGTTWLDARKMRDSIIGSSTDILHLHGVWNVPESVVLTSEDYSNILNDGMVDAARKSFGFVNTLIFVGFGAGLSDPHFRQVWKFLEPLHQAGVSHFTLCREQDVANLSENLRGLSVIPYSYGREYDDLTSFIERLLPSRKDDVKSLDDAMLFNQIAHVCRTAIVDSLEATSLIRRAHDENAESNIDELVIEPLLLPVPPEQFVNEINSGADKLTRLDPMKEIRSCRLITLVGEEQSGLTTSLMWSIVKKSDFDGSIPIVLDYLNLGTGNKPVKNAIVRSLRAVGAPLKSGSTIPSNLAVAIDNVSASNELALKRVVEDVVRLNLKFVIFGCGPGVEIRIQHELEKIGAESLPAYLGRIGRPHAIQLALRRVDADQATVIADRVLSIAQKEGLARTPLAVILLINGVADDEGWINSVSNTNFLDSFVDSLLGRGGVRDDMRLQIDSGGYSQVLERLSWRLIEDDSASISRSTLLEFFKSLVVDLDWSDNPDDIIRSLIRKGLLVDRDGNVRFRQSVYLHVFAARATRANVSLLEKLKSRPLYYSPIIRHYAALSRKDQGLVEWAYSILEKFDSVLVPVEGIYRAIDAEVVAGNQQALIAMAESGEFRDLQDGTEAGETESEDDQPVLSEDNKVDNSLTEYDPYETMANRDRDPFPSSDLENAPLDIRTAGTIALVSNIVRDSELIENPVLKEDALKRTLRVWGVYMNFLHESDSLRTMVSGLADAIARHNGSEFENVDDFKTRFIESWSMFMAFNGISEELSTIKLKRAAKRISNDIANRDSAHLMIPTILLQMILDDDAWESDTIEFLIKNNNIRAVRVFVFIFVQASYYSVKSGSTKSKRLESFLAEFSLCDAPDLDPAKRKRVKNDLLQQVRMNRAEAKSRLSLERGR